MSKRNKQSETPLSIVIILERSIWYIQMISPRQMTCSNVNRLASDLFMQACVVAERICRIHNKIWSNQILNFNANRRFVTQNDHIATAPPPLHSLVHLYFETRNFLLIARESNISTANRFFWCTCSKLNWFRSWLIVGTSSKAYVAIDCCSTH